jgi:FkbM family methyltransferase
MLTMGRRGLKLLGHFYPFYGGCSTLANTTLFKFFTGGESITRARLRDGQTALVRMDEYVGRSAFYFGDLDRRITWICRQWLRPGDTFLDIGANCGVVTLFAAKQVGSTGCVHAFEPQPALTPMLRKSLQMNGHQHVRLHEIALSDHDGTMDLFVPNGNRGAASLTNHTKLNQVFGEGQVVQVKLHRLDDYFKSLKLEQVRLIKIDVEGHELPLLKGGLEFLKTCKPDAIIFESLEEEVPFWQRGVVQILTSLGYRLVEVQKARTKVSLRALSEDRSNRVGDFLAIQSGAIYDDAKAALKIRAV